MSETPKRLAVVLFNLGGPDSPEAVQPFLFNLFNDPAIIRLPGLFRWLLAKLISSRRAPTAREIYAHLGGKSPLLELTREQATALEQALGDLPDEVRVFITMRYWHPMSDETARAVKDFAPDRIVALPLYPQFSTTTSASSLDDWQTACRKVGLEAPQSSICCYPLAQGWIEAQAALTAAALPEAAAAGAPRVLFSAHGLPKKIVDGGDPYVWQVEQTSAAVAERLEGTAGWQGDWSICYQSRVGPMEWVGPSTEAELARAAADQVPVVVVPIAFVSEHSETLVELDIEYREEAQKLGVPGYVRVPAVGTHPSFIAALKAATLHALSCGEGLASGMTDGIRLCPRTHGGCRLPLREAAHA